MSLPRHDVLAFDVYGTLIDTAGVVDRLTGIVGDRAREFSERWRTTQLGYSWRRALMRHYVDFGTCTRQALDHTAATMGVDLTEQQRTGLLDQYAELPAYPDVAPALEALAGTGARLVAFTNGTAEAVTALLAAAGVGEHLADVVSVDEVRSFKPDPAVYHHLLERIATRAERTVMVSSNPFDVLGAGSAGLVTAWVRREGGPAWDPWEGEPDVTVSRLTELAELATSTA